MKNGEVKTMILSKSDPCFYKTAYSVEIFLVDYFKNVREGIRIDYYFFKNTLRLS